MEELIAFFFLIICPVVLGTWDIISTILDKFKNFNKSTEIEKNNNDKKEEKINDKEKKE
jgi:hypothetical protein